MKAWPKNTPAPQPARTLPSANELNVLTAKGTPPSAPTYQPLTERLSEARGETARAETTEQATANKKNVFIKQVLGRGKNMAANVPKSPQKRLSLASGGGKAERPWNAATAQNRAQRRTADAYRPTGTARTTAWRIIDNVFKHLLYAIRMWHKFRQKNVNYKLFCNKSTHCPAKNAKAGAWNAQQADCQPLGKRASFRLQKDTFHATKRAFLRRKRYPFANSSRINRLPTRRERNAERPNAASRHIKRCIADGPVRGRNPCRRNCRNGRPPIRNCRSA